MLASLLQLVIGLVTTIVGAMLLLRAWLYYWAVSSRHPLVEMSRRTTDWLVGPLSKIVPAKAGIDRASILGAFLTACVTVVLIQLLAGGFIAAPLGLAIAPFALLFRWALEMISWGTLIWAVLTWVNPGSPMTYTLALLIDPFLRPVRRMLPNFKGIDFAPLVVILLANVLLIFVAPLSRGYLVF